MISGNPEFETRYLAEILGLSIALGARQVSGWTDREESLARALSGQLPLIFDETRNSILQGNDPLGDIYCHRFTNEERRPRGATYTPQAIINAMLSWASDQTTPTKVVDMGIGSGRFLVAAGRLFPKAELVGIDIDPMATIMARGHLAAAGLANRSHVILGDYREMELSATPGPTLFLGNPPYVRHHLIQPDWKQWLTQTARLLGHEASQLAGLHVHFFLATALHGKPGDIGILITAAEWLDVNYGRLVRELLMGPLGAKNIHVIEPCAEPFSGTQSTAVITGFEIGTSPDIVSMRRVERLDDLGRLESDWQVGRDRLVSADRWTPLTRPNVQRREGFVELGELCRVHRGQVTGANEIWIANGNPFNLPEEVLFPSITRARELFATDGVLSDSSILRRVIDLPVNLDEFDPSVRRRINRFLKFAKSKGTDDGFIARHRKAWWSVGLRDPAPILATYMARRPPKFVRNIADARHINVAHGLYPRVDLGPEQLVALADFLSTSVSLAEGRTYAGGLTKFEPREMERLLVPTPSTLSSSAISELLR